MERMQSLPTPLVLNFAALPPGAGVPAADVNCSLSFSAKGIRLMDSLGPPPSAASIPVKAEAPKVDDAKPEVRKDDGLLPASELAKLEGPATISGDSLQLSIYNGTSWQIQEITIGLTILRHPSAKAVTMTGSGGMASASVISASAVPASAVQIVAKRSDTLMVYHLKGSALPNNRATFTEPLGMKLGADQEWHWAILEAKGVAAKSGDAKGSAAKGKDFVSSN